VIAGNDGNNVLTGKGGTDTLTGGAGADRFVFNTPGTGTINATDFVQGVDLFEVVANQFGGGLSANGSVSLVTAASAAVASLNSATGYFIFDNAGPDAGTVWWDSTAGSGNDAVKIATLNGVSSLASSDFLLV
jgi:serralysin